MSDFFSFADELGPLKVIHVHEPSIGLKGVLVVDNVAKGPSIGGVRMALDVTTAECARLARAMTFKNAAAGLPHGVMGVGAQVHDDLMDLGRIGSYGGPGPIHLFADVNGCGQRGPQQLQDFFDHQIDPDRAAIVFRPTAERKNSAHEIFGPMAGSEHLLYLLPDRVAG